MVIQPTNVCDHWEKDLFTSLEQYTLKTVRVLNSETLSKAQINLALLSGWLSIPWTYAVVSQIQNIVLISLIVFISLIVTTSSKLSVKLPNYNCRKIFVLGVTLASSATSVKIGKQSKNYFTFGTKANSNPRPSWPQPDTQTI